MLTESNRIIFFFLYAGMQLKSKVRISRVYPKGNLSNLVPNKWFPTWVLASSNMAETGSDGVIPSFNP